jgi:hypothetical protein
VITLKLIGWEKGLQAVSLMSAIREHSDASLVQAKAMVEGLLAGQVITIGFSDAARMEAFRRTARDLGAKCE